MKRMQSLAALTLAAALCIAPTAFAGKASHRSGHGDGFSDRAKVVKVTPVYQTVTVNIPEEHCWQERVQVQQYQRNPSYTAPLVGAILGGVVGNQFGSGSGNTAMTVAGTLLGASIGRDARRGSSYSTSYPQTRCENTYRQERRHEVVAYDVSYRYQGRLHHTRMDYDPGDTLRVAVEVHPVN